MKRNQNIDTQKHLMKMELGSGLRWLRLSENLSMNFYPVLISLKKMFILVS